ncbi:2-isopropylmalate synthase [Paenibacillus psychroresistens]|uniref:2-isopropylmalate synthase n=1 Tax=Paenibacillus psychroresistens TaxID=1778678 RepID=A0A6B8RRZ4_9BACL|nr:2-isopropylmalate synthase [Paenibacillus psychroresistens]QGQ98502.1 2-isopropylmalate synthase [Paenibacillus psychroresistens]
MKKIQIFDTTLRDGEQAPGASLSPEAKIRIARQLVKLGVDVLEPGFPISSPGEFAAVQQISREMQGIEICGFARSVREDIDSALKATQDAEKRRIHMFLSSSDIHLDFQLRKSREQVVEIARRMVAHAKQFVDRIEFSPMDATRTGEEFLHQVVEAVIAEGATIINIPDTVGYALPEEYGRLFTRVRQGVRGGNSVEYSAHCHNDLGLAVANSIAAIQAGVTQVEVTVNGIGERAGNCSLEELVMALETRKLTLGVETSIQLQEIYATSRMVRREMNFPIALNKPIVGRNAFQHEAGIHQDGLIKNRNTYEIMDPIQMGIPRKMIILGKHSGRHAIKHRLSQLSIVINDQQLEPLYEKFKVLADTQKIVTDAELVMLLDDPAHPSHEAFEIQDMQVVSGSDRKREAIITLYDTRTSKTYSCSAAGAGAVEALIGCIKQAMPFEARLVELEVHSMYNGESSSEAAEGEAEVTIEVKGDMFIANGIDTDIAFAAAKAYLAACNQAIHKTLEIVPQI